MRVKRLADNFVADILLPAVLVAIVFAGGMALGARASADVCCDGGFVCEGGEAVRTKGGDK